MVRPSKLHFPYQTPSLGSAELLRSFQTPVVAALRPGTCPALHVVRSMQTKTPWAAERATVANATVANPRESISRASIAARTILIGLLYWNVGLESPFPTGSKPLEKVFMMNFFLTFSILLQSLGSTRKWTPRTLVPIQNCSQNFPRCNTRAAN